MTSIDDAVAGAKVRTEDVPVRFGTDAPARKLSDGDDAVIFHFRAVAPFEWDRLVITHPPETADGGMSDSFWQAAIKTCCTDEVSAESWDKMFGNGDVDAVLNHFYYDQMCAAVLRLNRQESRAPLS